MIDLHEVRIPGEKSAICEMVLRALPDWFGIETSLVEYTRKVRDMPFIAAFDGSSPIGFVALKVHNACTAEVYVMGILPAYHRRGIGKVFIEHCEGFCATNAMAFLTVKTLDESAESEEYRATRRFYQAMGFMPLEVFPLLWDEANPCLFLAKYVGGLGDNR